MPEPTHKQLYEKDKEEIYKNIQNIVLIGLDYYSKNIKGEEELIKVRRARQRDYHYGLHPSG